jgi:site-specific DNA-methyltransferase (adenine-specific)
VVGDGVLRVGSRGDMEAESLKMMFSSATDMWATPQSFFDELNNEFHFTLDPCATKANAKCNKFYTIDEDGLQQDWKGEVVFCNPPYGKMISSWVRKCSQESKKPNTTIVALLPARTDTRYFHDYIYGKAKEIRFIKGRLKFGDSKNSAPFPSMVVVF